jgi:PAS domain S-box-containing protein
MKKNQTGSQQSLRNRAEKVYSEKAIRHRTPIVHSSDEAKSLVHELLVHQIELEMQNEELQQAHVDLKASQARYIGLYDLAPVGYLTISRAGLVLEVNLTAAHLLGLLCHEIVHKPASGFVFKDDQDIYYLFHKKLFDTGKPQACELRVVKKDGTFFWTRFEARAINDEKGPTVCHEAIMDITNRKQAEADKLLLEQQIQKNQKLESIGLLAGGIAHDFNNLLAGIYGYVDLANAENDRSLSKIHLSKALNTLDRARGLTEQLLTFAKGGAPVCKVTDIAKLITESVQFALCGSSITCSYELGDLWTCNVDANQMCQVIDNMVINAKQAMPAGGAILVRAQNVSFREGERVPLPEGKYVQISIKDTGVGIPLNKISKIFDPFYTTKTDGRGLGLATSHSIISRHGGTITVESEPGKGATFHICLPVSWEPASAEIDLG